MQDARGLDISTDSAAVIAAADHFRDHLLSLGHGTGAVLAAADDEPSSAILNLYAAAAHLYAQDRSGEAEAKSLLDRAAACETNERERALFEAIGLWTKGDYEASADRFEALTERWPRDLVAMKLCEFQYYAMGQHWSGARFRAHTDRIAPENDDSSHFIAMWAFAYELCGERQRAVELAERALETDSDTPWAHHALAHALLRDGRPEDGQARLAGCIDSWRSHDPGLLSHNGWHVALFAWAVLDFDAAWEVYRSTSGTDSVGVLTDAISFLWRLDLAGEPADDEDWKPAVEATLARVADCTTPFVAAHFAYALGRAGELDALETLERNHADFVAPLAGTRLGVWQRVGLPLLEACGALGRGADAEACSQLEGIHDELGCVGGSDAQDDLFRQALIVALARSGRAADARAKLDRALDGREPMPIEARWLGA